VLHWLKFHFLLS